MLRIASRIALPLALCATFVLAGCGDGGSNSAQNIEGVFRRGNGAEPKSLDPVYAQGAWENNLIGDMLMGLTTEDVEGNAVPGMATSWETSEDGLTWTFHLRDANWSDGTPVVADDFVFAWRRLLDPKIASSYAYYLYPIKNAKAVNDGSMPATALGISAPDPKTVVISLEAPVPYLVEFLTHYVTFPEPRHVVESLGDDWVKPGNYVSNGAYTLKEWIPNDHVTLAKNPNFFDAANVQVNTVIYYPTVDYNAGLKRVRAGELDIQDRYPQQQVDWIRANMPDTIHPAPLLTTEYVTANFAHKPLDDQRIRRALSMALDRETLTGTIMKVGHVPAYGIVPPGMPNIPHDVALDFKSMPYANRVAEAQTLMKQAGYGPDNPFKTTLLIRSTSAESRRVPVAIQQMWRAIYVDAEIVQTDAAIFYDRLQSHDFDIAIAAWSADFADATNFLEILTKGNSNNYGQYNNPRYDALVAAAAKERDMVKRGQIMAEAETLALKDNAWIPEFFWVSQIMVQPYVKGWVANSHDINRTRFVSIDEEARRNTVNP